MPGLVEIEDAMRRGRQWIGWGPEKGCPLVVEVHTCSGCGEVLLGSVDDLTRWLQRGSHAPMPCWHEVLDGGLAIDQRVWTSAFAAQRHAERAVAKLRSGQPQDAVWCATMAADLGREIVRGAAVPSEFDPWGPLERAIRRAAGRAA